MAEGGMFAFLDRIDKNSMSSAPTTTSTILASVLSLVLSLGYQSTTSALAVLKRHFAAIIVWKAQRLYLCQLGITRPTDTGSLQPDVS